MCLYILCIIYYSILVSLKSENGRLDEFCASSNIREVDGYRLVHMPVVVRAMNEAMVEHLRVNQSCAENTF